MKKALMILLLVILIFITFMFLSDSTQVLGINKTVGWAWDISSFVWWIVIVLGILVLIALLIGLYYLFRILYKVILKRNRN